MDVDKLNRFIAEKANGWTYFPIKDFGAFVVRDTWKDQSGAEVFCESYRPTTDAAQAFELVERFNLDVAYTSRQGEEGWSVWRARNGGQGQVKRPDLKTAICLCVARMHGWTEENPPGPAGGGNNKSESIHAD